MHRDEIKRQESQGSQHFEVGLSYFADGDHINTRVHFQYAMDHFIYAAKLYDVDGFPCTASFYQGKARMIRSTLNALKTGLDKPAKT